MKTVTVAISPNGETALQVSGVVGTSCTDETAALENALGGKQIGERQYADEYFAKTENEALSETLTA